MSDFARLLEAEIPRLRRYARALTRGDVARADDIIQSCLTRAVAKQHLWQPGTDLRAWLFTILHNQFVNHVRRQAREGSTVPIENAPMLPVEPNAMPRLELRDLEIAINKLPHEQRQVILLVGLEGMAYDPANTGGHGAFTTVARSRSATALDGHGGGGSGTSGREVCRLRLLAVRCLTSVVRPE